MDKSISEYKSSIQDNASKNDISESILAALTKYDQQSGRKVTNDSIKSIAEKLGKLIFDYGGNQSLALAALGSSKEAVDAALRAAGYDAEKLRAAGQQGQLQNIDARNINISQDTINYLNKVNENNPVTNNSGGAIYYNSSDDDYDPSKSPTASKWKDLIDQIAPAYGLSKNALATLMTTENYNGDLKAVNINADSADYGLAQTNDKWIANPAIDSRSFKTKLTGVTLTSIDQLQTDPVMSIEVGAWEFSKAVNRAGGNLSLAYGIYNGGQGQLSKIIAAGLTEDRWATATADEVVQAYRAAGLNQIADNIERFNKNLGKGIIKNTSAPMIDEIIIDKDMHGNKILKSSALYGGVESFDMSGMQYNDEFLYRQNLTARNISQSVMDDVTRDYNNNYLKRVKTEPGALASNFFWDIVSGITGPLEAAGNDWGIVKSANEAQKVITEKVNKQVDESTGGPAYREALAEFEKAKSQGYNPSQISYEAQKIKEKFDKEADEYSKQLNSIDAKRTALIDEINYLMGVEKTDGSFIVAPGTTPEEIEEIKRRNAEGRKAFLDGKTKDERYAPYKYIPG